MRITRLLLPSDLLYRRLDPHPGFWDRSRGVANALAFLDDGLPYEALSFGVARHHGSPAAFLEASGRFRPVRERCGTGEKNPTARQMWDIGYGVAEITVQLVLELGLTFRLYGEHQYSQRGHADVMNGQSRAAVFALRARVLTEIEIFP